MTLFHVIALVSRDLDNPSLRCVCTDNFAQRMEFRQNGFATAAITSVAKDNLVLEVYSIEKENCK